MKEPYRGIREPSRVCACPIVNEFFPKKMREDDEFEGQMWQIRKNVLKKDACVYKQAKGQQIR